MPLKSESDLSNIYKFSSFLIDASHLRYKEELVKSFGEMFILRTV
jgi:hypothetical protein